MNTTSSTNGNTVKNPVTASTPFDAAAMLASMTDEQKAALRAQLKPARKTGPEKELQAAYLQDAGAAWERWQGKRAAAGIERKPVEANPFLNRGSRKEAAFPDATPAQIKALVSAIGSKAQNAATLAKTLGGKDAGWSPALVAHVAKAAETAKKVVGEASGERGRFSRLYKAAK